MIVYHVFNVPQYLSVATMRFLGHAGDAGAVRLKDTRGLGVEHKGDGEEALDPFYGERKLANARPTR